MSLPERTRHALEGIAKVREALLFFIFGLAIALVGAILSLSLLAAWAPRPIFEWSTTIWPTAPGYPWSDTGTGWSSTLVGEEAPWSAFRVGWERALAITAVAGTLAAGGALTLVGSLRYRRGFEHLSKADPRRFGIGRPGALLVLVGSILMLAVITWPIGAILVWIGLVLSGIALIRLGEEYENTLTVVSSILVMVPPVSWLGAILLYFGLGEVAEALREAAGQ